ncbi:J domain-containing protein [Candidatus Dependentiae bacterium]|nr:J domain-containing protein [Candidatus Dependentiae bacterium]
MKLSHLLVTTALLFFYSSSGKADANFELWNKLSTPIYYSLGKSTINPKDEAKNYDLLKLDSTKYTYATLDLNKKNQLILSLQEPQINKPLSVYLYEFTPGKTIYVRATAENNKLVFGPQSGPLFGLRGKTERGYPLGNNVKESDITTKVINYRKLAPVIKRTPLTQIDPKDAQKALALYKDASAAEILNVAPEASQADISKAYRTLGLKWHPDKNLNNPQADAVFKMITNAFNKLKGL